MKILLYILLISILTSQYCYAQNRKIDSLQALLKTDKEDTNKVIHLYKVCGIYNSIGEYDKGLVYGKQALALCDVILNEVKNLSADASATLSMTVKKCKANSYNNIG
ncbi:MAG TPA: hypothetical protein VF411_11305, partial [Bacteroidia bacterium]